MTKDLPTKIEFFRQQLCTVVSIHRDDFEALSSGATFDHTASTHQVIAVGGPAAAFIDDTDHSQPHKQDRRHDSIFALHQSNVALSHSKSSRNTSIDNHSLVDTSLVQLLDNINGARKLAGVQPLILTPELCDHATFYATGTIDTPARALTGRALKSPKQKFLRSHDPALHHNNTKIEHFMLRPRSMPDSARHGTRLVSGEPMGALACSEQWISGKFRKHTFPIKAGSGHPQDCACAEYRAYKIIMDGQRQLVGVARDIWGRWVVELLDPESW